MRSVYHAGSALQSMRTPCRSARFPRLPAPARPRWRFSDKLSLAWALSTLPVAHYGARGHQVAQLSTRVRQRQRGRASYTLSTTMVGAHHTAGGHQVAQLDACVRQRQRGRGGGHRQLAPVGLQHHRVHVHARLRECPAPHRAGQRGRQRSRQFPLAIALRGRQWLNLIILGFRG